MCLRQGRLYFESAKGAALEIRPLLLFYGMVSFARGVVIARSLNSLATLNQSHGLSDKSGDDAFLPQLEVEIGKRGTFQEFNDAVRDLSVIRYYISSGPHSHALPTATASELSKLRITLRDV